MIIHGKASEIDLSLVEQCDVMITDPEYSADVHSKAISCGTGGHGSLVERDFGFDGMTPESRTELALFAGAMKRWSILFSDFEGAHLMRAEMQVRGVEYIRTMPWIRWSQPQLSGDRPCTGAEAVLVFHSMNGRKPKAKHWNGAGGLIAFEERCMRGKNKHPAQKPLDIMLTIVSAFSDVGEAVFDPRAGWGTTGLACRILGRSFLGVEQIEEHAVEASRREGAPLDDRDRDRAVEWCDKTEAEAKETPEPYFDDRAGKVLGEPAYARAQSRLADVARVRKAM